MPAELVPGLKCSCQNTRFQVHKVREGLKLYCPNCRELVEGYEVSNVVAPGFGRPIGGVSHSGFGGSGPLGNA